MGKLTEDAKQPLSRLDANGHEILDNSPVAIPVRFQRQQSLADEVANLVRSNYLALLTAEQGYETFEESDDFDIGDDFDPASPYEMDEEDMSYDHRTEVQSSAETGNAPGNGASGEGGVQPSGTENAGGSDGANPGGTPAT